jgi:hypothetical protein
MSQKKQPAETIPAPTKTAQSVITAKSIRASDSAMQCRREALVPPHGLKNAAPCVAPPLTAHIPMLRVARLPPFPEGLSLK